jgi:predicted NBD/HSP70 family sugar kinase
VKPATPTLARAINDRRALDLLLEHGPLSAPQLRTLTGLSRPTVADLIERLSVEGLIKVTGETGAERRGPNARLYGLVGDRSYVAGVDVRRDGLHVTVADITGREAGRASGPVPPDPDLVQLIAEALDRAGGGRPLHTVVVGVPGLIHPRTSVTVGGEVPGWRTELKPALTERLGVQVILENEVNLAAIAEHRVGSAVGHADFALMWLDAGIGGAVVLDGRLRRGMSGGAGELGMLKVNGTDYCDLLEPQFIQGLPQEAIADRIVHGAMSMVVVLDPGLIVLGGATGRNGGDSLAALVAERLATLTPAPIEVRPSTVQGNTVLQGATLTALDQTRDVIYGPSRTPTYV